ncbi:MAG: helix-turn-helix domain-containing protein [Burkholderiaceae bacterium]
MAPPDVKAAREQLGLSQSEFAHLMQIGTKTLQNWEQHHRNPIGPAAALLNAYSGERDRRFRLIVTGRHAC